MGRKSPRCRPSVRGGGVLDWEAGSSIMREMVENHRFPINVQLELEEFAQIVTPSYDRPP
jgi:hypothetical protein